jgi:hypothetical protein
MALKKVIVLGADGNLQQLQSGDTVSGLLASQTTTSLTNGEATAVTVGMCVYVSAANTALKARANAAGTSKAFGLVGDSTVAASATANIVTDGIVTATTTQWDALTGQTGGLTAGGDYWLSSTLAGGLTATPVVTTGQYSVYVGRAISTTDIELTIGQRILL